MDPQHPGDVPGSRRTIVFGPAYLDRILRVDRPLGDRAHGPALDQSVEGRWLAGVGDPRLLTLVDPAGGILEVEPPPGWPGPLGTVRLSRVMVPNSGPRRRGAVGTGWHDDLGGMGAGFASALGGELVSVLGAEDDPTNRAIAERLARAGIGHHPIRVDDRPADWTLLITSGGHGDKLAIGFRGCHAAATLEAFQPWLGPPSDLRVVAGLPNRLAAPLIQAPGASVRFFAPAMRNMLDRDPPLVRWMSWIDVLSCNREEWSSLKPSESVLIPVAVSAQAITEGPRGSVVWFRARPRKVEHVRVPAFPRAHPPRDTNRAGEAYAATLVRALLDSGWRPGRPLDPEFMRRVAERASAAAALVLDRAEFGFPSPAEIDAALRAGRVESPPEGAGRDGAPGLR